MSAVRLGEIPENTRVEVYWNLHKSVFSVRACGGPQRGRVIAHVTSFFLKNVDLVVRRAGRQAVVRTGRKNVHAFARGEWTVVPQSRLVSGETVMYNPHKFTSFVTSSERRPVRSAIALTGEIVDARPVLYPSILGMI